MHAQDAWAQIVSNAPYDVIIDCAGYDQLFFDVSERKLLAHGGAIGAIAVRGGTTFPWSVLHTTEASIEMSCHFSVS